MLHCSSCRGLCGGARLAVRDKRVRGVRGRLWLAGDATLLHTLRTLSSHTRVFRVHPWNWWSPAPLAPRSRTPLTIHSPRRTCRSTHAPIQPVPLRANSEEDIEASPAPLLELAHLRTKGQGRREEGESGPRLAASPPLCLALLLLPLLLPLEYRCRTSSAAAEARTPAPRSTAAAGAAAEGTRRRRSRSAAARADRRTTSGATIVAVRLGWGSGGAWAEERGGVDSRTHVRSRAGKVSLSTPLVRIA